MVHAVTARPQAPTPLLRLWLLLLALGMATLGTAPAQAGGSRTIIVETVETVSYEWVDDGDELAADGPVIDATIGRYGPFRVTSDTMAEMVGTVDSYTPAAFRRMQSDHPGIALILMVDCPGSVDEAANLELARMIRAAGIMTHVPSYGSIRSGAVELFLSGRERSADAGAEFMVHSWMDEDGLQANDYPADDPVHREYLDYYAEMGVPAAQAADFYRLTNSVPFESHLTLSRDDLARYALIN